MDTKPKAKMTAGHVLWIIAGVVVASVLTAVASWLFSPNASSESGSSRLAPIGEETVKENNFHPETVPGEKKSGGETNENAPTPKIKEHATSPPPPRGTASRPSVSGTAAKSAAHPSSTRKRFPTTKRPRSSFGVQVGAFSSRRNARGLLGNLKAHGYPARMVVGNGNFKIVIPGFKNRSEAEGEVRVLKRGGFSGAFVVRQE